MEASSLTELYDAIKQIAVSAVNASNPVQITEGVITSISPLTIAISQQFPLSADFLCLTDTATRKLEVGNRMLLIRKQGGQKYYVLDKVGDAK